MEKQVKDMVIIGSGPAALTAAIYAARANLQPLLIAGQLIGGQLTTTTEVENFPGFKDGILGSELMENMQAQAVRFGTEMIIDTVTEVDLRSELHLIKTADLKTYQTKTLVIATGASAKLINLPAEKELMGYGVSTCATCDGAFFKNVPIAVVGGGDSACEEANFLTRFASKVYLIHRRDELRASKIMRQRVLNNPKIEPIWDTLVTDIMGDKKEGVKGLKLKNVKTNKQSEIEVKALFVAIGHVPNSEIFKTQVTVDEAGYIITKPNSTITNVSGVFACGDVVDHVFRQAITAAGTGCMAAIEAERYLESLHSR